MRVAAQAAGIVASILLLSPLPAFADTTDVDVKAGKPGEYIGSGIIIPDQARGKHGTPSTRTKTLKKIVLKKTNNNQRKAAIEVMCREARTAGISCEYTPPKKNGRKPAHVMLDLDAIARTLTTRIHLPDPTPQIGPDPNTNEWKIAAVGYPLWLWTPGPHTVTDQAHAHGITFTLHATWTSTHFNTGDGHTLTCTTTQPYTKNTQPGTPSPTCGHTYLQPPPHNTYTITATTTWTITWTAQDTSGSIPGHLTASRQLPVGELNTLIVK